MVEISGLFDYDWLWPHTEVIEDVAVEILLYSGRIDFLQVCFGLFAP